MYRHLTIAAALAATAAVSACAMSQAPSRSASAVSTERAFATTFASCRQQVRAGKTDKFAISPASPAARDIAAGETGLTLKAPYDKAMGRRGNAAFKANLDRCLDQNGYQVVAWNAR